MVQVIDEVLQKIRKLDQDIRTSKTMIQGYEKQLEKQEKDKEREGHKMQQIIAQLDVAMEKINAEIARSKTIIRGYEENIQRMQEEKKQLVRAIKAFNEMPKIDEEVD